MLHERELATPGRGGSQLFGGCSCVGTGLGINTHLLAPFCTQQTRFAQITGTTAVVPPVRDVSANSIGVVTPCFGHEIWNTQAWRIPRPRSTDAAERGSERAWARATGMRIGTPDFPSSIRLRSCGSAMAFCGVCLLFLRLAPALWIFF